MKIAASVTLWILLLSSSIAFSAEPSFKENFENAEIDQRINISGPAEVDSSQSHGRGKSLKLSPGSTVTIDLSDIDHQGKVQMWVYEDARSPKDILNRHVGPRWGLRQSDNRVLAVGSFYAPYLDGNSSYSASYFDGASWFGSISRLGDTKRKKGWHKWTFTMTDRKGLNIECDGKNVNSRRKQFDWKKTEFSGISGLIFYGDSSDGKQVIWIDDIAAVLPRTARNSVKKQMVPDKDPRERKLAPLTELMTNNIHPRLLITAEDLPELRRYAKGDGKVWMDKLNSYARACTPPSDISEVKFLKDATDGQRYGYWRLPTIALHYLLTGNEDSFKRAVGFLEILLELPHWETSHEFDSGMSSANVMIGAGLAFDWLYNDLDPEFREKFRQKIIYHARAQYYGGHLKGAPNKSYFWQCDPQNNHRWHRNAGMSACILAAYDGSDEQQWILKRTYDELAFIAKWLPDDGTCHESNSYMAFGGSHLMVAMQSADSCFGTDYLSLPFFANQARFRLHLMTPGMTRSFEFGDSNGIGSYNPYLFKASIDAGDLDYYAGLLELARRSPGGFEWGWQNLIWSLPVTRAGDYRNMDNTSFWPDMGIAMVRDGWESDNVAAMFKCGPYGGYKLNEYRNENNFKYVNVAHDDPDANMIQIAVDGGLLAENDRYGYHKYTRNHNSLLVNGSGQLQEGNGFLQPTSSNGPHADMTKLARVTGLLDEGDVYIVEGEASGAYPAIKAGQRWPGKAKPRPALERYRRTVIWVRGSYLLVLDDVKAQDKAEFTWLMQSPQMQDLGSGRYRMIRPKDDGNVSRDFQLVSDTSLRCAVRESTADNRGKAIGHQQLQASATGKHCRFASVYNLWQKAGLNVELKDKGSAPAEVIVTGDGIEDSWTWHEAEGRFRASRIDGKRSDGSKVQFSHQNRPPTP